MKFINWVRQTFPKKERANLRAIPGGNFTVPKEGLECFLDGFCKKRRKWKEGDDGTTWVWVPPQVDSLPLCVDIDLRYETQQEQPLELFEKYADLCGGNWVIVMKPQMYEKKPGLWAGGCHIYFQKEFRLKELHGEYERQLELIKEVFPDQDPKECLDDSVFLRKNGLIMPGCFKHQGKAGRYNIAAYRLGEEIFEVSEEQFLSKDAYGYSMDLMKPYFSLEREAIEVELSEIPEIKSEHFNLKKFLEATRGWVPNNSDWKQILFFLSRMKLDERKTADALNAAWNPSDPNENLRLLRKAARKQCTVTEASIIRMLKLHAEKWDRDEIFGKPRYYLHDHASAMATASNLGRVFSEEDVMEWMKECYGFVDGEGTHCWVYRETDTVNFYNEYGPLVDVVTPQTTTESPLKGEKEYQVLLSMTRAAMQKTLEKCLIKAKSEIERELIQKALDSNDKEQLEIMCKQARVYRAPRWTRLSRLLETAKERAQIKIYKRVISKPYLREDPAQHNEFNLFSEYQLEHFEAKGDFRKTNIWRWLTEALAPTKKKQQWLFSYFAKKIQFQRRKIGKSVMIFSKVTGVGKTSVEKFAIALLGRDKVLKVENVDALSGENSEQLGKLFCVVDDIERVSEKQANDLKSRITSETFTYKKLYKDKRQMRDYMDIWMTTNEENPAFMGCDDRRQEMIRIVPKFSGKPKFWIQFNKELANPHIMRGFFDFFSDPSTITVDVCSKLNRFDPVANKLQKISSLPRHIKFLKGFFENPNVFEDLKFCYRGEKWWDQIKPMEDGMYISTSKMYQLFTRWQQSEGDGVRVKKSTFSANLIQFLDLKSAPRTYFGKVRLRGFQLSKKACEEAFVKKYKFTQSFEFFWEDPVEFQKCYRGWVGKDWIYKDRPDWI